MLLEAQTLDQTEIRVGHNKVIKTLKLNEGYTAFDDGEIQGILKDEIGFLHEYDAGNYIRIVCFQYQMLSMGSSIKVEGINHVS